MINLLMLKSEKAYNTVVTISKELFIISIKVFTKYAESPSTKAFLPETYSTTNFKINDHKAVNIENTIPMPIIVIIDAFI